MGMSIARQTKEAGSSVTRAVGPNPNRDPKPGIISNGTGPAWIGITARASAVRSAPRISRDRPAAAEAEVEEPEAVVVGGANLFEGAGR